ncbi:hypothetical protein, partial [Candidatus Thiosymbion oneisti]|uniref:hypothetical protein n=1 Tax=Candidatus Thiosymbion oneisti TaxID=589554 RepID=UPI001C40194B
MTRAQLEMITPLGLGRPGTCEIGSGSVREKTEIAKKRKDAKKEQRIFASWRHCVLALNGPE